MPALSFLALDRLRLRISAVTLVLLGLAAVGGCRDATAPELRLDAAISGDSLRLHNASSVPLAYIAMAWERVPLIDWIRCEATSPGCLRLPPGASVTVPLEQVYEYEPGNRVIVYFWTVRQIVGEPRATELEYTFAGP
jgi:hypothetical protein